MFPRTPLWTNRPCGTVPIRQSLFWHLIIPNPIILYLQNTSPDINKACLENVALFRLTMDTYKNSASCSVTLHNDSSSNRFNSRVLQNKELFVSGMVLSPVLMIDLKKPYGGKQASYLDTLQSCNDVRTIIPPKKVIVRKGTIA